MTGMKFSDPGHVWFPFNQIFTATPFDLILFNVQAKQIVIAFMDSLQDSRFACFHVPMGLNSNGMGEN